MHGTPVVLRDDHDCSRPVRSAIRRGSPSQPPHDLRRTGQSIRLLVRALRDYRPKGRHESAGQVGGGGSATGCSDPPWTKPMRFPLNQALLEHASRLTAHHGRPAPGSRSRLPPDQAAAVTVRPIARLFPLPPALLTVGRAGRAWPVPCRWPYRRLGGCGLRDRPHRRLRPVADRASPARWAGAAVTLTASIGVMVAPRPGRHDHRGGLALHRDPSRGGRRCGRLPA